MRNLSSKKTLKMDWMYAGAVGGADREEYLLGKAIDRGFMQTKEAPAEVLSIILS